MPKVSIICIFVAFMTLEIQSQHARRQLQQRQLHPVAAEPILVEKEIVRPKVYEIRHQISPNIGDGSFRYYSATSDGLESEQVGHFSNPLDSQVQQGSYTTTDEFGQVVRIDYIADKNGFKPIGPNGAAILPTPPPVPLEQIIAREDILHQQKVIRDQHLGYLRAGYAAHGR